MNKNLKNSTSSVKCNFGYLIPSNDLNKLIKYVEDELKIEADTSYHNYVDVQTLETAGKMFAYLTFCPIPIQASIDSAKEEASNSIKIYKPTEILVILNRLLHSQIKGLPYRQVFELFLKRIRTAWTQNYDELMKLTSGLDCKEDCLVSKTLIEDKNLNKIANHPVHIVDEDNNFLPSSLIPFCWLGNNMEQSKHNEKLDVKVCSSFKAKLRNDQVCYEMDPNELLNGSSANNIVLYLLIDENKDRQKSKTSNNVTVTEKETFMLDDVEQEGSVVYLNTIGTYLLTIDRNINTFSS